MTIFVCIFLFVVGLVGGVYTMTQVEFRYWLKERSDMKMKIEKLEHEKKYWIDKWKNKYSDDSKN